MGLVRLGGMYPPLPSAPPIGVPDVPAAGVPFDPRIVPQPPRLRWGWVLALSVLTVGMFGVVWYIVQAVWVKRMTGRKAGLIWSIIYACAVPGVIMLGLMLGIVLAATGHSGDTESASKALETGIRLLFLVLHIATAFSLRSELEKSPIGLSLHGPMTFFFGATYFQYHLQDYVVPDAVAVYGPLPGQPTYVPPVAPSV